MQENDTPKRPRGRPRKPAGEKSIAVKSTLDPETHARFIASSASIGDLVRLGLDAMEKA